VEVLSHDPSGLAAHWCAIMAVPATAQDGRHIISVDQQTITIVSAPGATRERLDALTLVVRGAADILARARQMGLETREDAFALCGMWMRLREEAA
jgi:hypothetical protein